MNKPETSTHSRASALAEIQGLVVPRRTSMPSYQEEEHPAAVPSAGVNLSHFPPVRMPTPPVNMNNFPPVRVQQHMMIPPRRTPTPSFQDEEELEARLTAVQLIGGQLVPRLPKRLPTPGPLAEDGHQWIEGTVAVEPRSIQMGGLVPPRRMPTPGILDLEEEDQEGEGAACPVQTAAMPHRFQFQPRQTSLQGLRMPERHGTPFIPEGAEEQEDTSRTEDEEGRLLARNSGHHSSSLVHSPQKDFDSNFKQEDPKDQASAPSLSTSPTQVPATGRRQQNLLLPPTRRPTPGLMDDDEAEEGHLMGTPSFYSSSYCNPEAPQNWRPTNHSSHYPASVPTVFPHHQQQPNPFVLQEGHAVSLGENGIPGSIQFVSPDCRMPPPPRGPSPQEMAQAPPPGLHRRVSGQDPQEQDEGSEYQDDFECPPHQFGDAVAANSAELIQQTLQDAIVSLGGAARLLPNQNHSSRSFPRRGRRSHQRGAPGMRDDSSYHSTTRQRDDSKRTPPTFVSTFGGSSSITSEFTRMEISIVQPPKPWTCLCGLEHEEEYRFCGFCGTSKFWTCTSCQFDRNKCQFNHCGGCGARRQKSESETTANPNNVNALAA